MISRTRTDESLVGIPRAVLPSRTDKTAVPPIGLRSVDLWLHTKLTNFGRVEKLKSPSLKVAYRRGACVPQMGNGRWS